MTKPSIATATQVTVVTYKEKYVGASGVTVFSPRYLGKQEATHPASYNNRDHWLVYDTDDDPIQVGVWYSNDGTPTRITTSDSSELQGMMLAATEDIAWAEKHGYQTSTAYGGFETVFQAMGAVRAYIDELFANTITARESITVATGGTILSQNYATGVSGFKMAGETGDAEFNDVTVRGEIEAESGNFRGGMGFGTAGAIFSGGYDENGNTDGSPGTYINGQGEHFGDGAYYKNMVGDSMKTFVDYKGDWVSSGAWSSPIIIFDGDGSKDYNNYYPTISNLNDGQALLLHKHRSLTSSVSTVFEVVISATGELSDEVELTDLGGYFYETVELTNGRIFVVYEDAYTSVYYSIRDTNGVWSTPVMLSDYATDPICATYEDDTIVVLYHGNLNRALYEKVIYPDGTISTAVSLFGEEYKDTAVVTRLSDDTLLVLHIGDDEYSGNVYESIRNKNTGYSTSVTVYEYLDPSEPELICLPDDSVKLFYSDMLYYPATTGNSIVSLSRSSEGLWGTIGTMIEEYYQDGYEAWGPRVCMLGDGKIAMAISRADMITSAPSYIQRTMFMTYSSYWDVPKGNYRSLVGAGIIESGKNDNGYYIKYSDGTLICYHKWDESRVFVPATSGGYTISYATWTWTFPCEFTAVPQCYASGDVNWGPGIESHNIFDKDSLTAATVEVDISNNAGVTATDLTCVMAIGRWKSTP